jgi:hypothetical protein
MNLRKLAVKDVKNLNVKDWGIPLELMGPDGTWYRTDNETGALLQALQVTYDYRKLDPQTGLEVIVNEPVITVSLSSLARIPIAGERWIVRIPVDISHLDVFVNFVLTEDRAPEGGASLGFIRLYPQKAVQL